MPGRAAETQKAGQKGHGLSECLGLLGQTAGLGKLDKQTSPHHGLAVGAYPGQAEGVARVGTQDQQSARAQQGFARPEQGRRFRPSGLFSPGRSKGQNTCVPPG